MAPQRRNRTSNWPRWPKGLGPDVHFGHIYIYNIYIYVYIYIYGFTTLQRKKEHGKNTLELMTFLMMFFPCHKRICCDLLQTLIALRNLTWQKWWVGVTERCRKCYMPS